MKYIIHPEMAKVTAEAYAKIREKNPCAISAVVLKMAKEYVRAIAIAETASLKHLWGVTL